MALEKYESPYVGELLNLQKQHQLKLEKILASLEGNPEPPTLESNKSLSPRNSKVNKMTLSERLKKTTSDFAAEKEKLEAKTKVHQDNLSNSDKKRWEILDSIHFNLKENSFGLSQDCCTFQAELDSFKSVLRELR